MCGAYYLLNSPSLANYYGVTSLEQLKEFVRDYQGLGDISLKRPTMAVPFVRRNQSVWEFKQADYWWLVLKPQGPSWAPDSKWASFNARMIKFFEPPERVNMHRIEPISYRVLVPASGFIEWQGGQAISLAPIEQNFFFAGVAKSYFDQQGREVVSLAIITLPGHPRLKHIHEKSVPLMIHADEAPLWLDHGQYWQAFDHLRRSQIRMDLVATPLAELESLTPAGQSELIRQDAA